MDKFSYRLGNLEARLTSPSLVGEPEPNCYTVDIKQWSTEPSSDGRPYCWSIAYFVRHKEGWDLQFVGNRPFADTVDWTIFGKLAREGVWRADCSTRCRDRW